MTSPLLSALVQHYDDLAAHLRRRFGADRSFAFEVVHDVCVDILERPHPEPVRHPLALLRRMSHNKAVDHLRAADLRRQWVEGAAELPEAADPAPEADRVLDAQRELERLAQAIDSLPERCRLVFVMHKVHGMAHDDVARRLGITRKTVEKHMRLGMAACRARLGRDAP